MQNKFIFTSKNLGVRLGNLSDTDKLYEIAVHDSGKEVLKDKIQSVDDVVRLTKMAIDSDRLRHYPFRYIITRKADGDIIGYVCYKRNAEKTVQLIISIADKYRGQGYASELLGAAVKYGKQELGLAQIYCIVTKDNAVARHIMEKNGFSLIEEYEAEWSNKMTAFERYRV